MVKWIKRISIGLAVLFLISIGGIRILLGQMEKSETKLIEKYSKSTYPLKVRNQKTENYNIRWVEIGDAAKPTLFFIHGSPGSLDNFETFFNNDTLLASYQIVSVDRPGYGGSEKGKTVESIIDQAALLEPVLDLYTQTPTVLIGWSYGGPLATAMAGMYPEKSKAMMLLASAASPEHEKIFFFNKPLSWKALSWILPSMFRVSNEEKLSHVEALKDIEHLYADINIPVVQIHGDADPIVPVANGEYVEQNLAHNPRFQWIRNKEDNHFLPTTQKDLIISVLIEFLKAM